MRSSDNETLNLQGSKTNTETKSFCSMVVRDSLVALLRYKGCSGNEFAAADALI